MATATTNPTNELIIKVGQKHPEYTVSTYRDMDSEFPYIIVRNSDKIVTTQIRLPEANWTVGAIDYVVTKAIKKIESNTGLETPEERKKRSTK